MAKLAKIKLKFISFSMFKLVLVN